MPRAPQTSSPPAAPLPPRQGAILAIVTDQGFATVEALAERFGVSPQTIRREIIQLDRAGLLQRFHGGAGLPGPTVRLGYARKQTLAAPAKDRIGAAAAALVPDGASVFLDVGTTVEAVARALRHKRGLRVFTSSLPAAMLLAGHDSTEVFVTGGVVRGADGSLVGDSVTQAIAQLRVDVAVIGFSGVDEDGSPMDFDIQKVAVKQAVIANARSAVAVGDSLKFARQAVVRIGPPSAFARLVTDAPPPARLAERFAAGGLAVTVAAGDGDG